MKIENLLMNAYNRLPLEQRITKGRHRGQGDKTIFLYLDNNHYLSGNSFENDVVTTECQINVRVDRSFFPRFDKKQVAKLIFRNSVDNFVRTLSVELQLPGREQNIPVASTRFEEEDILEFIHNYSDGKMDEMADGGNVVASILKSIYRTLERYKENVIFGHDLYENLPGGVPSHLNYNDLCNVVHLSHHITNAVRTLLINNDSGVGYKLLNPNDKEKTLNESKKYGELLVVDGYDLEKNKNNTRFLRAGLAVNENGFYVFRFAFLLTPGNIGDEDTRYLDILLTPYLDSINYGGYKIDGPLESNINLIRSNGEFDELWGLIRYVLFDLGYNRLTDDYVSKKCSMINIEHLPHFTITEPNPLIVRDSLGRLGFRLFHMDEPSPIHEILAGVIKKMEFDASINQDKNDRNINIVKLGQEEMFKIIIQDTNVKMPVLLQHPMSLDTIKDSDETIKEIIIRVENQDIKTHLYYHDNTTTSWNIRDLSPVAVEDIILFTEKFLNMAAKNNNYKKSSRLFDKNVLLNTFSIVGKERICLPKISKFEKFLADDGFEVKGVNKFLKIPVDKVSEVSSHPDFIDGIAEAISNRKPDILSTIDGIEVLSLMQVSRPYKMVTMKELNKEDFVSPPPVRVDSGKFDVLCRRDIMSIKTYEEVWYRNLIHESIEFVTSDNKHNTLNRDEEGNIYIR